MLDKEFILKKIKHFVKNANIVLLIIFVNIVVYLIGGFFNLLGFAFNFSGEPMANYYSKIWFYIPSDIHEFAFKPYTLLTYQFLHRGFFHIMSNMAIVYYFGTTFINLTHKKKLLALYLLGGIFSGIFYLVTFNFFPQIQSNTIYLVGASGSAMAILAAVATLIPNREINLFNFFNVKYKWLAFFFLALNIIAITSTISENNIALYNKVAGNLAHVGGLVFGFLYIKIYQKGYDMAKPINNIINIVSSFFIKKKGPKISYINEKFKEKKQFDPYKRDKKTEEKMNAILDKIKIGGYENLTKAEKDFFFNNSKQD